MRYDDQAFRRDAFHAQLRHVMSHETHVRVGDHDPEPRHTSRTETIPAGVHFPGREPTASEII